MAAMAISNNLNELDTLLQVGQGMKKCIDYYEEVAADQYNGNCPGPVGGALQRQVHGGGDQRGDTAGANTPLSTGLLYPKLRAQTSGIIQKWYETKTITNTG